MYRDSLKKLRRWVSANSAALRLCARMTVAGLLAYLLAELFALPQGYWAVFSAIIIMQASVGGSVKATLDRLYGVIWDARTYARFCLDFLHFTSCPSLPVGRQLAFGCQNVLISNSLFELPDRVLAERRIAAQIVRIEDRMHAAQRVAGDGRDLRHGASGDRQPRDCGAAQDRET